MFSFLADIIQGVFAQQVDVETILVRAHSRFLVFARFVVAILIVLAVFDVETVGSGKGKPFHYLYVNGGIGLQVIVFLESFFGIHQRFRVVVAGIERAGFYLCAVFACVHDVAEVAAACPGTDGFSGKGGCCFRMAYRHKGRSTVEVDKVGRWRFRLGIRRGDVQAEVYPFG